MRETKVADVERAYARLRAANDGVGLPALRHAPGPSQRKGRLTVGGTSLAFFACHLGRVVPKTALVAFLRRARIATRDPQPRHLGMQAGFDFLVAGCVHPRTKVVLRRGEYCLMRLRRAGRPQHRSRAAAPCNFAALKVRYDHRCAVCGSAEFQPHLKNRRLQTRLERAHMDPRRPLGAGNCIPMCALCNRVYRNRAVFNRNGFVSAWLARA